MSTSHNQVQVPVKFDLPKEEGWAGAGCVPSLRWARPEPMTSGQAGPERLLGAQHIQDSSHRTVPCTRGHWIHQPDCASVMRGGFPWFLPRTQDPGARTEDSKDMSTCEFSAKKALLALKMPVCPPRAGLVFGNWTMSRREGDPSRQRSTTLVLIKAKDPLAISECG